MSAVGGKCKSFQNLSGEKRVGHGCASVGRPNKSPSRCSSFIICIPVKCFCISVICYMLISACNILFEMVIGIEWSVYFMEYKSGKHEVQCQFEIMSTIIIAELYATISNH